MPRLTSLSGAQVAVLFDDPLGIVEFDEVADGVPQLRDVAVDATMDDLFLQRAIDPLGNAVGLGLGDEGVGRLRAEWAESAMPQNLIWLVKWSDRYWEP